MRTLLHRFHLRNRSAAQGRDKAAQDVVAVGKTAKLIKGDYGKKEDQFRRYEP